MRFCSRAWAAVGVALALKLIIKALAPLPPLKLPIVVPSKVTLLPLVPISPVPVPWLLMVRLSVASAPELRVTVRVPPSKLVLLSARVAAESKKVGEAFSA